MYLLGTILLATTVAATYSTKNLTNQSGNVFYTSRQDDVSWRFTWGENRSDVVLVLTSVTFFTFEFGEGSVVLPDGVAIAPYYFLWGTDLPVHCGAFGQENSNCTLHKDDVNFRCDVTPKLVSSSVWPPVINSTLRRAAIQFSYYFHKCSSPETVTVFSSKENKVKDNDTSLLYLVVALAVSNLLWMILIIFCGCRRKTKQVQPHPMHPIVEIRDTTDDTLHNIYHIVEDAYALADDDDNVENSQAHLAASN